jgi:hypothetical protein
MQLARTIAFILIFGCCFFLIARRIIYLIVVRHLIKQAVDPHYSEAFTQLDQLNAESKEFTFLAKRAFTIIFRKKNIALVDGHAGHTVVSKIGPSWELDRCLYAVTSLSGAGWFEMHSDTFTRAFYGTEYAVFWAKPRKIQNG